MTAQYEAEKDGSKVIATYHTHPITSCKPSKADKVACRKSNLPMVIVSPLMEEFLVIEPTDEEEVEILGREFVWGVHDCLGLVRDVYKKELGIELKDYDRGVFGAWNTNPEWNLFVDCFQDAGFIRMPEGSPLKNYDVLLMNWRSDKINHCAIMMDAQQNLIWHHLAEHLSEPRVYGGWLRQITRMVIRHQSQLSSVEYDAVLQGLQL
jgi:cell wall-associated NlpC family hydrolase